MGRWEEGERAVFQLRVWWTHPSRQAQVVPENHSPCLWALTLEHFQLWWEDSAGSSLCSLSSKRIRREGANERVPVPNPPIWIQSPFLGDVNKGPGETRNRPLMKNPPHRSEMAREAISPHRYCHLERTQPLRADAVVSEFIKTHLHHSQMFPVHRLWQIYWDTALGTSGERLAKRTYK